MSTDLLSTPDSAAAAGRPGGRPLPSRVRVEMERRAPGIVALAASPDHLLRIQVQHLEGACTKDRFRYAPGDADILPAGLAEEWEEFSPSTTLALRLPGALLHEAAEQVGLGAGSRGLDARFQLRDPQIEHLAWALHAERAAGSPNGGIYADFLGMALAIHLLGRYRAPAREQGGLARHLLRRVTDYIEAHLDQDLALATLAGLAGMSGAHFGRQFRKSTGYAVHEYVVRRRVERARRLLADGSLSASQVALDAGFAHQSHMAKWMQRILGVTPSQVRATRLIDGAGPRPAGKA